VTAAIPDTFGERANLTSLYVLQSIHHRWHCVHRNNGAFAEIYPQSSERGEQVQHGLEGTHAAASALTSSSVSSAYRKTGHGRSSVVGCLIFTVLLDHLLQ
jgi:hypothetical protein